MRVEVNEPENKSHDRGNFKQTVNGMLSINSPRNFNQ